MLITRGASSLSASSYEDLWCGLEVEHCWTSLTTLQGISFPSSSPSSSQNGYHIMCSVNINKNAPDHEERQEIMHRDDRPAN